MAARGDFSAVLKRCRVHNIELGNQIGKGSNGRIREAKWEGILVAVKEIHSIFVNEVSGEEFESFKERFERECIRSSELNHPNVANSFLWYLLSS